MFAHVLMTKLSREKRDNQKIYILPGFFIQKVVPLLKTEKLGVHLNNHGVRGRESFNKIQKCDILQSKRVVFNIPVSHAHPVEWLVN